MTNINAQVDKWVNKAYLAGSAMQHKKVTRAGGTILKRYIKNEIKSLHPQRVTGMDGKKKRRRLHYRKGEIYVSGNLDRSIQILTHIKRGGNTWVGTHKRKGSSPFVGSSVDAYYAHMVNKGHDIVVKRNGIKTIIGYYMGTRYLEKGAAKGKEPANIAVGKAALKQLGLSARRLRIT